MIETSIFITNKTQAVRLPVSVRFDEHIKKVAVRIVGKDRIISPIEQQWDSFFFGGETVSDDFMVERETAIQSKREDF